MKNSIIVFVFLFCYSITAQVEFGVDSNNAESPSQERIVGCGLPTPGNLVINGDFEQYSLLPSSSGQIVRACNWGSVYFPSSPDYFHRNAPPSPIFAGIPINFVGNQEVNSNFGGDAYGGILYYVTDPVTFTYREIIRNQLDSPLIPNTDYQLTFDVSLAELDLDNAIKLQAYLGAFHDFSTGDEFPLGGNNILLTNTEFSTNSEGWDTITFCFTTGATAGQEYLYLGGISNTENIPGGTIQRALYYIDNIYLTQATSCGSISVTKEAYYLDNPNASTDVVYVNRPFEWRVTIENTIPGYQFQYEDIFPDSSNTDCGFTIMNISVEGPLPIITIDPTLMGTVTLGVGTYVISFTVRPCNDSSYSGTLYENCFNYVNPDGEWESACDEVLLVYGCPAALSDGFCLFPEDLEEGDTITSELIFHVNFSDIVKLEGDLIFDSTKFDTPSTLADIFDINIPLSSLPIYTQTNDGIIHFIINTQSFNIGIGGTSIPFSVNLVLSNDLEDCTSIVIDNFEITEAGLGGDVFPIYVDPGVFCFEFDSTYESAWIITEPGDICDDGSIDLTVIGPFETQNPSTTYLWSPNGETTQTITATENGVYSVSIVDNHGCERFASYAVVDCPTSSQCECGDLQPEIIYSIENCYVTAYSNITSCENLTDIDYIWTFSNGTTYNGEFPPVQYFQDFQQGNNTITLEINYKLSGSVKKCSETVIENIYVECDTGIINDTNNTLSIYPNPAYHSFTISVTGRDVFNGNMELLSMFGRVLQESKIDRLTGEQTFTYDVSNLQPGMYFIRFIDDSGSIETKRLIVK